MQSAKPSYPLTRPLEEQEERESQKLWAPVTDALQKKDQNVATSEKTRIEDEQRAETARRTQDGIDWAPKLFRMVQGGPGGPDEGEEDLDWIINAKIDGKTPEELTKQVLSITQIVPGQSQDRRFSIPSRRNTADTSQVEKPTPQPKQSAVNREQPSQNDEVEQQAVQNHAQEETRDKVPDLADLNISGKFQQAVIGTMKRQDSETNEIDEFHDAKS